jgi:hypothetical protein
MGSTHLCLTYHLIFSTKHRKPLIHTLWQDRLYAYMGGIIRECGGGALMIGGLPDHMHLLIQPLNGSMMKISNRSLHGNLAITTRNISGPDSIAPPGLYQSCLIPRGLRPWLLFGHPLRDFSLWLSVIGMRTIESL